MNDFQVVNDTAEREIKLIKEFLFDKRRETTAVSLLTACTSNGWTWPSHAVRYDTLNLSIMTKERRFSETSVSKKKKKKKFKKDV